MNHVCGLNKTDPLELMVEKLGELIEKVGLEDKEYNNYKKGITG